MNGAGGKILRASILFSLVVCATIFLPAGTFNFWQAWLLIAVYTACSVALMRYLLTSDRALLARRMQGPLAEQSRKQQILISGVIVCYFAAFVVSGFDHRLGWSTSSVALALFGNAIVVAAFATFMAVMRANTFASTNIEVESEQRVISSGPYAPEYRWHSTRTGARSS
jgi:protein-S-isoprenylcysteine O-methyltransferase Ste14